MNILAALDDPQVFGAHFRVSTWDRWHVFLAALFSLPMTPEQLAIYQKHTGRNMPPATPLHEAWLVIGRRGGKSFVLAVIAVFLASFKDWRGFLGPGEIATVMVVAADRRQARVIMRYCLGLLKSVPMLEQLIERETAETITLRNRVSIEIHTASFRSTRGYTIVAALLDEIAYWPTDESSAEPDIEVIDAIRPGRATIPGRDAALCASVRMRAAARCRTPIASTSPWMAIRSWSGRRPCATMNRIGTAVSTSTLTWRGPGAASAEYMAPFRSDLEAFVSREVVRACVSVGASIVRHPRPHAYVGFVDPSGGSGADLMTLLHRPL